MVHFTGPNQHTHKKVQPYSSLGDHGRKQETALFSMHQSLLFIHSSIHPFNRTAAYLPSPGATAVKNTVRISALKKLYGGAFLVAQW